MKTKVRKSEKTVAGAFGRGMLTAILMEIVIIMLLAAFTSHGVIAEGSMNAFTALAAFISAFTGAAVAAGSTSSMKFPTAMGVGAALFVISFTAGRTFGGNGDAAPWYLVPLALLAGSALAGLLSARKKKIRH